jgi:protein CpxP
MKSVRTSVKASVKGLVLAGLLAGMGHVAMAQSAPPPMDHHGAAQMQEHMAKRQAELKAKLKLTAAQEAGWTTFTASMQPPAGPRPDRAAFEKLTTPERIDKMRALRAERDAAMDKRAEATKAFYATLTPEQQKVFDANAMQHGHRGHGPEGQHHKG